MPKDFSSVKRRQLENRLSQKMEEYEAVSQQISLTLSAADQVVLKNKLNHIEDEIAEIREQLDAVKGPVSTEEPLTTYAAASKDSTTLPENELFQRTLRALRQCWQFDSDSDLLNLFADEKINPWQNVIPSSPNKQGRVAGVVAKLKTSRRRDGRNGLMLLLEVLRDSCDEELDLYHELDFLGRCWATHSNR